jgi:site-specific recombinase XerD
MKVTPLTSTKTACSLPASELERGTEGWLLDCEIRQHSKATLELHRIILSKLAWFVHDRKLTALGTLELRQFIVYLTRGHEQPGGRWGIAQQKEPVTPSTVQTYHRHLRTFFRWLVAEGLLEASPMEAVPSPVARPDQIQPFTTEQINALLQAAKRSPQPRRNTALIYFLLDTGLRATEVCSLCLKDMDMQNRRCSVVGKGNKRRTVPFGGTATKELWQYLREDPRDPEDPLFYSKRSEPLTRSGLFQLLERLGTAAGIEVTRCSPHTMRHTFAVEFLRAGGNVFTLQQLLGHTTLTMTNRYVALAQADIEAQHRQFSPADRLKKKSRTPR